ncbi:hypothetical protein BGZ99_010176, partial [Dissophora globulifera]
QQKQHTASDANLGLDIGDTQEARSTSVAQGVDIQRLGQRQQQPESGLQASGY